MLFNYTNLQIACNDMIVIIGIELLFAIFRDAISNLDDDKKFAVHPSEYSKKIVRKESLCPR